ncbi:hypothetical protein RGI145_12365 [Roseomonas gilardii]|uniref:Uncharacterized protein n=1 Tax=Roseomonas gilardii TaxID=257708 RepID=A0A1L7AG72_9PROT|nr:hypothetical protein [Roseomonas gilardii]APT57788.1 hypothetical protein RGI145_12365 [Roseomonas gilardii]
MQNMMGLAATPRDYQNTFNPSSLGQPQPTEPPAFAHLSMRLAKVIDRLRDTNLANMQTADRLFGPRGDGKCDASSRPPVPEGEIAALHDQVDQFIRQVELAEDLQRRFQAL